MLFRSKEYRVDLTYFEINGKRYSDASYTSYKTEMSEILTEVRLIVKGKWSVWSDSPYESILVIDDTETAAFNLRVGEPIADGR